MNIFEALQKMEARGVRVTLSGNGNELQINASTPLSEEQTRFLQLNKHLFVEYLQAERLKISCPHEYATQRLKVFGTDVMAVLDDIAWYTKHYHDHDKKYDPVNGTEMVYPLSVQWQRFYDNFFKNYADYELAHGFGVINQATLLMFARQAQIWSVIV